MLNRNSLTYNIRVMERKMRRRVLRSVVISMSDREQALAWRGIAEKFENDKVQC
jgi:hypothetical protein